MRKWFTTPDVASFLDYDEIPPVYHVLQGKLEPNGDISHHGHLAQVDCDCRPRIEETLDKLIVIHKRDV